MKLNEFDTSLMTTKIVFDEDKVSPGDIISVFKIDALASKDTKGTFVVNGIVTSVTPTVIKFSYYANASESMEIRYLYANDVLVATSTASQFESTENIFIFKVTKGTAL